MRGWPGCACSWMLDGRVKKNPVDVDKVLICIKMFVRLYSSAGLERAMRPPGHHLL